MVDRLRKLNRCATNLDALLDLAEELDQYESDMVTEALLRRILNAFETTHPQPEVEMGVGTVEDRRKFLKVIEESNKGVVFQGLRDRMKKYLERHTEKGSTLNEYLYLFSRYFRVRILGTYKHWEVVLVDDEMHLEIESEELVVQELDPRVQIQQYVSSYGSKIEFLKEDGQTRVSLLGQTKLVPQGRIFEDEAIQDLMGHAESTQRVPFKYVPGGPIRGQGQLQLVKTHQFEAVVQVLEGDVSRVMVMDRAEELLIRYKLQDRESVVMQVGDGRVQKNLKFFGEFKGQKKRIKGKIGNPRLVYSTDQSAERLQKGGSIEIVHAAGAVILQLHKDFPKPEMLCPLKLSLGWYSSFRRRETCAADAEGFEKMMLSVLQMRRRKITEFDFLLNITYHPHVPAIGKYLCSVGAKRVDEGGEIWWHYDKKQQERVWLIWEHVFYQEPLPNDEKIKEQLPFFLESIPACLPLIQPLAYRNHVKAVKDIERAFLWSDEVVLELSRSNLMMMIEDEEFEKRRNEESKMDAMPQKES